MSRICCILCQSFFLFVSRMHSLYLCANFHRLDLKASKLLLKSRMMPSLFAMKEVTISCPMGLSLSLQLPVAPITAIRLSCSLQVGCVLWPYIIFSKIIFYFSVIWFFYITREYQCLSLRNFMRFFGLQH